MSKRVPFKLESVKYAEGNIKECPGEYNPRYEVDLLMLMRHINTGLVSSHLVAGVKSSLKEINVQAVIRDNMVY